MTTDRSDPLGARRPRIEDDRLVRGLARHVADLRVAKMLEAVFVRSPYPAATIAAIDATAALAIAGVEAVLTAADLPHEPLLDSVRIDGLRKTGQPAIAADRVRFVGEPVAIVLAKTRALAEDGAAALNVDWRPQPFVIDTQAARAPGAPLVHDEIDDNNLYAAVKNYGDPEAAFNAADLIVKRRLIANRYLAAPLEGRGCLAAPGQTGGFTVHASTMGPHLLRRRIAQSTGIPEQRLRVIAPDVGGSFGIKIPAAPEEIAVVLAARATGRPVRWVEGRREQLIAAPHSKDTHVTIALAATQNGELLGIRAQLDGNAGAYSFNSASALIEPYLGAGLLPGPYTIDHVAVDIRSTLTNTSPMSPYRGVGWTQPHTARELVIDEAARRLGLDPAELRRRNLVRNFPYRSATGMVYDSGSYAASLDRVLERLGPPPDPPSAEVRVGVGVTVYVEPAGWGSDGALQSEWSFASHDSARLQIDPTGGVLAAIGTPSQGQGHATTLAQVVAAELGVRVEDVSIVSQDTDATPVSTAGTRASRIATVTGGALALAARKLRERLLDAAAAVLEIDRKLTPLTIAGGIVSGGSQQLTVRQVSEAAHFDLGVRARLPEPDLVVVQFHDPPATYSNGAIAALVEVDLGTGGVTLNRLAVIEDCGTILNPAIVEGQTAGAVVQGIGGALYEDVAYGADGHPRGDSFGSYLLPRIMEIPEFSVGHEVSPSPTTVNGVKGMGESGSIAAPAAIACAVENALSDDGFTVQRLPLTPQRIVTELMSQQATDSR